MALAPAAQDVIRRAEKNVVLYDVDTMEHRIAESIYSHRLLTSLSGGFGALALVLAAIGLYGVLSYWVGQHTREIGIRMALGAEKADVIKRVLFQGLGFVMLGLFLGVIGAIAASRFLTSFLFSVSALDLQVFVAASLLIMSVAGIAAYLPAHRATKVDPMVALRYE
jgi:putative ABC transport system permease protein